MHEVKAFIRLEVLPAVVAALQAIPRMPGITVSTVRGFGRQHVEASNQHSYGETQVAKLEVVVPQDLLEAVLGTIQQSARTGRPGDGKIFVTEVDQAILIRTGDSGPRVL